jgi:hypothetical protein
VSGGVRFDDSAPFEAVLTSDALRHTTGLGRLSGHRVTDEPRHVKVGDRIKAKPPEGWVDTFEVVAIERTVDDEGRVSPTGAAIVYLREVSR